MPSQSGKRRKGGGKPKRAAARTGTGPEARLRAPLPRREGGLLWRALGRIPFIARRRAASVDRKGILAAVPFRNPLIEWEVREPRAGGEDQAATVVLRIPRRQDRVGRILNRLFSGPDHRQVILDELGTDVWQMCDGETPVEALIRELSRKHKLERREVEISLLLYLKTLAQRGYIGLRVATEPS